MAKKPTQLPPDFNESDIPEQILKEARERVIREAALEIARREMGLIPAEQLVDSPTVRKGPLPLKGEKKFTITLDLAEHSDRLVIDGVIYLHGQTYTVGERLYNTMREMIHRGWEHQREIDGKNGNAYRKPANILLSPQDASAA